MHADSTTPTAAAVAIDIRRFPWIRRLATDYAFAFERVAPFFAGDPARADSWAEVIRTRHAHRSSAASSDIARVIAAQQERRQAPTAARAACDRLADPNAVVIITGQQAGLFGGPLFTLLKAVTAMKLADRVSRDHHLPVVPVFWIDAEDHDWAEVSSSTVLDANFDPRTITLGNLAGAGDLPIARLTLDDQIAGTIAALHDALPETEFRTELIEQVGAAYRTGTGMAEAFGRFIETVLGPRGLVVFDSADPAAKPLVKHVFVRELDRPGETAQLAARAGEALVSAGYHAQVTSAEGAVSLFYLNAGREPIRFSGKTSTVGERQTTLHDLCEEARHTPQHFSPNVLLRPIVQDTLFPTICYVAGPNELAYLGQLREVYQHFNVPMPLMYQRATATVADSATLRFLSKYSLPFEALQAQDEAALNQLLQDQLPPTVEQALTSVSSTIDQGMAQVSTTVPQIDPTLEGAVKSTVGRMQHDLRTLHNKVIQAAKRKDETLRRQFQHAKVLAFPNGHPQEREIGFIWFQNRYGPALVDRLFDELSLEMGYHWVVSI